MRLLDLIAYVLTDDRPCLNPYSTGNEVVGTTKTFFEGALVGLNPYSTGNEVVGVTHSA